ncbi:MAG TPA: DUF4926 domain-containing protein [Acidobacteriaceae bacterium]|jgi:hypothetical protein|nr:DUF4926 domain-containing protein [Acidobacteriaceae bacterium]
MEKIELLAVVALLRDWPERRLVRGQVGTVVEILISDVVLVEFSDNEGQTYAIEALPSDALMRLHHRPREVAA